MIATKTPGYKGVCSEQKFLKALTSSKLFIQYLRALDIT